MTASSQSLPFFSPPPPRTPQRAYFFLHGRTYHVVSISGMSLPEIEIDKRSDHFLSTLKIDQNIGRNSSLNPPFYKGKKLSSIRFCSVSSLYVWERFVDHLFFGTLFLNFSDCYGIKCSDQVVKALELVIQRPHVQVPP